MNLLMAMTGGYCLKVVTLALLLAGPRGGLTTHPGGGGPLYRGREWGNNEGAFYVYSKFSSIAFDP